MMFLIDPRGEATYYNAAQLRAGPFVRLSAQSVIHSGYISWQLDQHAITIRFRPSLVTPSAFARLGKWLDSDLRHRMHLVCWSHGEWHHELAHSPAQALRRIDALISFFGGGRFGHVASIPGLRNDLDQKSFKEILGLWRERKDCFDPVQQFPALHECMKGRASLFEVDASTEMYLVLPGAALTEGTRKWAHRNPNSAVSRLPYFRASKPIFEGFSQANAISQPVHDNIDGVFLFPGQQPVRLSYRRLVLPFAMGDKRWVVSATKMMLYNVEVLPPAAPLPVGRLVAALQSV